MELNQIIKWYENHHTIINILKDVIFSIGVVGSFYGYCQFLKFLSQKRFLNKKEEMKYDLKVYEEIKIKLKDFVDPYHESTKKIRDINIRLMHITNYPYGLKDDGYNQKLYYYFLSPRHSATGYITSKGLYVMEHIYFWGEALYYNQKKQSWFIDKKGKIFNSFEELGFKQIVRHIPFTNIVGYDFESEWSDYNEPVFYTRYKYDNPKLYSNEITATNIDDEYLLANQLTLNEKNRKRKIEYSINKFYKKVRSYMRLKKN